MDIKRLPIGVIDSGKGGIGVIHYLSFALKNEDFLFYMDNENFPYGNKSRKEIKRIGEEAISRIIDKSKMIILACNTLGCHFDLDVQKPLYKINECIMEDLKRKAKKGKVLFLTTFLTKRSGYFQNECDKLKIDYQILSCPRLVNMVENRSINFDEVKRILSSELNKDYSVVVLGCTHFYYLEEQIKKLFPKCKIVSGYNILEKKIKKDLRKYRYKNLSKNGPSITVMRT